MTKIKIAIILDQKILAGGGYQQALNAILLAKDLKNDFIDLAYFTTIKDNMNVLSDYGIKFNYININFTNKFFSFLKSKFYHPRILKFLKVINKYSKFEKIMISNSIDLIYFVSPSSLAKEVDKLNYILTVWDLNYLYNNEFPEFKENKIIETIHDFYTSTIRKATAIIVDSEMSREDVSKYFLIDKKRVHSIPFQPGQNIQKYLIKKNLNQIEIKKKYSIKYPYIFYPAQFWAHKNHTYILQGIKSLENKFKIKISAIFAGGDQGNLSFVKNQVKKLKLNEQIHFIGFVKNEEIPFLYEQCLALVMPTYFGPTNIPPLEAFDLGAPVLYPDLKGLKDQVGDAALLMDLKNPETMAQHINNLITDSHLRERLVEKGYERASFFKQIDRKKILEKIIDDYKFKLLSSKNLNDK
ncbi:glycosyltransferase family 4 protein [Candidatus Pelagibacter sp. HIMB1593]|uniref:glycosyltransferase family 4 protein n=1 Tax=Candidatus Pelagibacter sp. HIMB1593 TaxID=3413355 RepID=UPI003F86B931